MSQNVFASNANRTEYSDVPDTLYRVTHSESASRYSPEHGTFSATAPDLRLGTDSSALEAVCAHLNPRNQTATPFISTTSSAIAALRLATYYQTARKRTDVRIALIDAAPSPLGTYRFTVLHARMAAAHLGYEIPRARYEWTKDEYLVLRKIPHESVVALLDVAEFEAYLDEAAWFRAFRQRAKHQTHPASSVAAIKAWMDASKKPYSAPSKPKACSPLWEDGLTCYNHCGLDPDCPPAPRDRDLRHTPCEASAACKWCGEFPWVFSRLHINGVLMAEGEMALARYRAQNENR